MSGTLRLRGATSGYSELQAPAVAADQTFILPTAGGTLLTTDSPISKLTLELGSASQPSLTFEGDTDTGLYSSGTNTLNLVTGGNNRLNIDSSGNVGVGTTSPLTKLQVQDDSLTSTTPGTNIVARFQSNGSGRDASILLGDTTTSASRIGNSSGNITLHPGSATERMRIDTSGNVGIGTTTNLLSSSTRTTLSLNNSGSAAVALGVNGTREGHIYADASSMEISATDNPMYFTTGNSERMRINSSGLVGINTTNPGHVLDVNGSFGVTGTSIFDDTLQVGGEAQLGAAGTQIFDGGNITIRNAFASNDVFRTLVTGSSTYNIALKASGEASFLGNVGIGTSSPDKLLHVSSGSAPTVRIENTTTSVGVGQILGAIEFEGNDASTSANGVRAKIEAEYRGIGAQTNLRIYVAKENVATPYQAIDIGTGGIVCNTENTERMRIDGSGNVGIGTSSPESQSILTVNDQGSTAGYVSFENRQNYGWGIGLKFRMPMVSGGSVVNSGRIYSGYESSGKSYMQFNTYDGAAGGEFERMRIDSSGQVGIGTGSVDFSTFGSNTGGVAIENIGSSNTGIKIGDGSNRNFLIAAGNGHYYQSHYGSGDMLFGVGATGTERMRINNSGNVSIGTTTVDWFSGDHKLVVRNSSNLGSSSCVLALQDAGGQYPFTAWNAAGSGTKGLILFRSAGAGSVVGSITTNGSSTTYSTSSDYRLKENVVDIANGITRVKQLQPKRFNFIADADTTVDGFLAHEAQTVVPEAVTGVKDEVDDDGNAVMQGIDQSKLVPLLTAALQEAIGEIEILKTKVAALEAG